MSLTSKELKKTLKVKAFHYRLDVELFIKVDTNDAHTPNTLAFKFEIDSKDKCVNKSYYEVNLFERAVCIDSEMHSVFNLKMRSLCLAVAAYAHRKARKQQQMSKNKFHLQMKTSERKYRKSVLAGTENNFYSHVAASSSLHTRGVMGN